MSKIQKDSFWYVDRTLPEAEQIIRVMCTDCFKENVQQYEEMQPHERPWFWDGSESGYGDYDCKCSLCEAVIHQRGEEYVEENQTSI